MKKQALDPLCVSLPLTFCPPSDHLHHGAGRLLLRPLRRLGVRRPPPQIAQGSTHTLPDEECPHRGHLSGLRGHDPALGRLPHPPLESPPERQRQLCRKVPLSQLIHWSVHFRPLLPTLLPPPGQNCGPFSQSVGDGHGQNDAIYPTRLSRGKEDMEQLQKSHLRRAHLSLLGRRDNLTLGRRTDPGRHKIARFHPKVSLPHHFLPLCSSSTRVIIFRLVFPRHLHHESYRMGVC